MHCDSQRLDLVTLLYNALPELMIRNKKDFSVVLVSHTIKAIFLLRPALSLPALHSAQSILV